MQAEIDRYNTDSVRADRFIELVAPEELERAKEAGRRRYARNALRERRKAEPCRLYPRHTITASNRIFGMR